ncbi:MULTISPECIES: hypothetical protein [unclassified Flavobacterium]|uniref:hypothetical protein n=1 Tax=unclassified Flavobacterium TaxID=196869 RepID=UPI001F12FB9A|nr:MULTISPECIES: hypothetical protein [unclassified Flavobacterium]UMY66765.1 hypothetical protein MKO97_05115 [Flavobacterium sp. HJ-32-4]
MRTQFSFCVLACFGLVVLASCLKEAHTSGGITPKNTRSAIGHSSDEQAGQADDTFPEPVLREDVRDTYGVVSPNPHDHIMWGDLKKRDDDL